MKNVRDPYWKINPDVVADESAADRYEDEPNPDYDPDFAAQLAEELSCSFDADGNALRE